MVSRDSFVEMLEKGGHAERSEVPELQPHKRCKDSSSDQACRTTTRRSFQTLNLTRGPCQAQKESGHTGMKATASHNTRLPVLSTYLTSPLTVVTSLVLYTFFW